MLQRIRKDIHFQRVQLNFLTKAIQSIPSAACSVLCYMVFPYIYPFI